MKKRALIVPAAFIILSLLCSVFLVGWASPFYYYMRSYSFEAYSSLEYEAPENNSEFTEKMQKLCNYADRLYHQHSSKHLDQQELVLLEL